MGETCECTGRMTGYTQHPDFLETMEVFEFGVEKPVYVFEFFVCGVCLLPTTAYLDKKMESVG